MSHCNAHGCSQWTRESKPYCSEHVLMNSPHVAQLAAKVEERSRSRPKKKPVYGHTCTWCQAPFECLSGRALYCGDICRDLARIARGRTAS